MYHGFQSQKNASSIQEEFEKAIGIFTGTRSRIKGAGRTDAGVHATGQVVAFDTEVRRAPKTFLQGLNFHLPNDIAVKKVLEVSDAFDPRRDAISRTYIYFIRHGSAPSPINRRTEYQIGDLLDVESMRHAAKSFLGQNNFVRFAGTPARKEASTIRKIYSAEIQKRDDSVVTFEVEGDSFLPHQVRRMIGALVGIGRGKSPPGLIKSMLDLEYEAPHAPSLPPQGLFLSKVKYKEGEFDGSIC